MRSPIRRRRPPPPHLLALEARVAPAAFTVENANDAGAGSLRRAINDANAAAGADTIDFAPAFFNVARTISLLSELPALTGATTIAGPGAELLRVRRDPTAADNFRVFDFFANVTLSGVTVSGGVTTSNTRGGGIRVRSAHSVTVTDCVITGNSSALAGGGVWVQQYGTLTIRNSTVSGNTVTVPTNSTAPLVGGGGIAFNRGGVVLVENCTVADNASNRSGGGIRAGESGRLTVRNSTISGNAVSAGPDGFRYGGGIYVRDGGTLVVEGSTVSGNSCAAAGGGVYMYGNSYAGAVTIRNSTIANNNALVGGGLAVRFVGGSHALTVQNSTVAGNTAAAEGGGVSMILATGATLATEFASTVVALNAAPQAVDVSGTANVSFGLVRSQAGATLPNYAAQNNLAAGTDPLFVGGATPTLADNGGPTRTIALQAGSPLVNAGANPAGLATDQRGPGFPREVGPADVGAFERVPAGTPTAGGAFADLTAAAFTYTFQVTYADNTAINVASLGANDIRVTGPNGFDQFAEFVGVDNATNGTPRTATYRIAAPFTATFNGTYVVGVRPDAVTDTDGNAVPAGVVGTFRVLVPATFVVTNADDAGPGSLRAALDAAAAFPTADTVFFDPVFFGVPRTISLTSGQLVVASAVTVVGPGAGLLTVRRDPAAANFRVFQIDAPGVQDVVLSGLTISGGRTNAAAAPVGPAGDGAGILLFNDSLRLDAVVVTGNTAGSEGGGIAVASYYYGGAGTLVVRNSTISGNRANGVPPVGSFGGSGGGIYFANSGSLLLENSTISGNASTNGTGGGLYFAGLAYGAGVTIRNATVAGNAAVGAGGGIRFGGLLEGTALIQNSTIAGNTATGAGQGGGLNSFVLSGSVVLASTVIAFNAGAAGPDVFGPVTAGTSLIRDAAGATIASTGGNLPAGTDPLFVGGAAPTLADNGGPTPTIALQAASPLLNVGANPAALTTDQRGPGFVRTSGAGTDIGAFEVQPATPPRVAGVVVNAGQANLTQRSRVTSVTVTFDRPVTFAGTVADAFAVSRITGTAVGAFTAFATIVNGVTVVTLSGFTGAETQFGSLADGRYTVLVRANQVTAGGLQLDGDGNGTGGDDYALNGTVANGLYRLFGDVNPDGVVNAGDFGLFRGAFGSSTGQAAYLAFLDFDGDGFVNAFDFAQFRPRFGGGVP